jgi:hypothetical protein
MIHEKIYRENLPYVLVCVYVAIIYCELPEGIKRLGFFGKIFLNYLFHKVIPLSNIPGTMSHIVI